MVTLKEAFKKKFGTVKSESLDVFAVCKFKHNGIINEFYKQFSLCD